MEGVYRFLARVYRLISGDISDDAPTDEQQRLLHFTIKKVRSLYFLGTEIHYTLFLL